MGEETIIYISSNLAIVYTIPFLLLYVCMYVAFGRSSVVSRNAF